MTEGEPPEKRSTEQKEHIEPLQIFEQTQRTALNFLLATLPSEMKNEMAGYYDSQPEIVERNDAMRVFATELAINLQEPINPDVAIIAGLPKLVSSGYLEESAAQGSRAAQYIIGRQAHEQTELT